MKLTAHLHLVPRSKNAWSYTSVTHSGPSWRGARLERWDGFTFTFLHGATPPLPQYVFMAWCSGKHRDNFASTLYPVGTGGSFPGSKGWSVKLTAHLHLVTRSRIHGDIPPLPNTSSWRGVQLKHRDNFTFTFTFFPLVPGDLSPGMKCPGAGGREADNTPPSSAEVKNAWSYTSTPQYVFMACA
jgi:hypothetical protein